MKNNNKQLYLKKDNPNIDESKEFIINARKYLGNKTNFITLINQVIDENHLNFNSVMELCMGTGVLSYYFAENGKKVIANDLLPLNFILGKAFMSMKRHIDKKKIIELIEYCNKIQGRKGELTIRFGDKFTSKNVSSKADAIIKFLKDNKEINKYEKYYIVSSLILALEKASEIDSDYLGLERLEAQEPEKLILKPLKTLPNNNVQVVNGDAIKLVKEQKADLVIIDPPFDDSNYSDYMVYPEQVVELACPEIQKPSKSDFYNKEKVKKAFTELIENLDAKYLMFWYSNDGIVSKEYLKEVIRRKFGRVVIYDIIRKEGLHLVRNEPKTDFMILGVKK